MKSSSCLLLTLLTPVCLPGNDASAPETVQLPPYVITAATDISPLRVTTDPRAPAQPIPAHDGADALRNIPGFSVIRKGGTDGDPVLRGQAGSRLGILVDGETILGGCGNRMDPPTAYVYPSSYDRITVVKGPQTVQHGPGNSAGVVLFERDLRPLPETATHLDASLTAASFGRFDAVLDAMAGSPGWQARGTATFTTADNYEDGDGQSVHSAYERWSTHASLAWTPNENSSLLLSGARSDGEAAYADRMMDGVKFDRENIGLHWQQRNLTSLVAAVEARFYHNAVDHVMDNYSLRPFAPTMMMPGRSVSNPDRITTGGLLQMELTPAAPLLLTAGFDTQRNRHSVRNTSNETTDPYAAKPRLADATFDQYGLFLEGTHLLATGQRLVAGARVDRWEALDQRNMVMTSMMASAPNPTAQQKRSRDLTGGFVRYEYDWERTARPVTFFAGLGRVQRFPDYWELIKQESLASVSAFATRPETTHQLDFGALCRDQNVEVSASFFAARIDDFILVQSGVAKPAGMMGTRSAVVSRNIDASTVGGELSLNWKVTRTWRVDSSVSYVRGENDSDGLPLAQMPPLEGRLGVSYHAETWSVGGLLRAVAAQSRFALNQGNIVGQDLGPSPGFAVASLHASARVSRFGRLSAGVDNLFDKAYAEHISRAGGAVAGFVQSTRVAEPGRTFWIKLDTAF